jgi:transposase
MYEAAGVILTRLKKASSLRDWAAAIAKRSGPGKARVALARKLSVILHSMWRSGEPFRWSKSEQYRGCDGCPPGEGTGDCARGP